MRASGIRGESRGFLFALAQSGLAGAAGAAVLAPRSTFWSRGRLLRRRMNIFDQWIRANGERQLNRQGAKTPRGERDILFMSSRLLESCQGTPITRAYCPHMGRLVFRVRPLYRFVRERLTGLSRGGFTAQIEPQRHRGTETQRRHRDTEVAQRFRRWMGLCAAGSVRVSI